MRVIYGLRGFKKFAKAAVLAIGVFDGLHIGHIKIIKKAVRDAKRLKIKSVVLTFDPHPIKILCPKNSGVPSLISVNHRIKLIEKLGVDILVVMNFNRALAVLAPGDFVKKLLVRKLGVREVCVGENFYFGKGGAAGVKDLDKLGRSFGFKVSVVKPVRIGRAIVSSSLIRKLITSGELRKASKLLGRRVSALGTVISGARLARELGYPTANLNPHHEVIPPGGVYAVFVRFKGKTYKGVLNIGLRPTFYSPRDRESAVEVHIFDFKEKIYGHDLEVFFVKKLRDEVAFAGKNGLVKQIKKDEKAARNALKRASIDCS
ncbi:MAG: bifunctional riboflavin kinase/FAD synthetase [Candidatus Omnitrophica bacterium]|nr:bifunctional riboflavin kinase/FAD synthetase [Candidatus Omnitrophota bacterium]